MNRRGAVKHSPAIRHFLLAALVIGFCGALLAGREPKTVITGDQMEIRQGGKKVVFSGNSKVTRGESMLQADRLVQDKKDQRVEAEGRVRFKGLTQDRELVEGRSEKAIYSPESGSGELWEGRPRIVYHVKTSSEPVEVEADRILFDQSREEITARGAVDILSSSATAHAPSALFRQQQRAVILSGTEPQPELIYRGEEQKGRYRADHITMFMDSHTVVLKGNVTGVVDVKELDKKR